jgi:hypothetical protein
MFGALPAISAAAPGAAGQMAALMPQPKKAGMFGSGGPQWVEAVQAALAGALAARGNPAGQMGLQMLQQKRQQAMQEEQYQQRRGDEFEDWVKKQAWEIANKPKSANPHYFEDNSGNLMAIGPDGKPQMVHKDPLPFKLVPNGLGGVVPVDLRTLMAGQGQQGVPQTLSDDDWPTQGGPTPQASGGFPRPY